MRPWRNIYKGFSRSLARGFSIPWLNISVGKSLFCLSIAPTKRNTLYVTRFSMKFLKLAFIYKNHDTLRYLTFLYTKSETLCKKQDNFSYIFIYKIRTLCVTRFFMEFLKLAEGGAFLNTKNGALC